MSDFLGRLVARTLIPAGTDAPPGTVQPRLRTRFEPPEGTAALLPLGNDAVGDGEATAPVAPTLVGPATIPLPQPAPRPSPVVAPNAAALPFPPTVAPGRPARLPMEQREAKPAATTDQPLAPPSRTAADPIPLPSEQAPQQPRTRTTGEVVARSALLAAADMRLPVASTPEQQRSKRVQDAPLQPLPRPPVAERQSHSQLAQPGLLPATTYPYAGEQMLVHLRTEIQRLRLISPRMEDGRVLSSPERPSPHPDGGITPIKENKGDLEAPWPKIASSSEQPTGRTPQPLTPQMGHVNPQTMARLRVELRQASPPARQANEVREAPPPPVVVVHIGRIEVRAAPPTPAPHQPQPRPRPAVQSLDDYLRRRNGQGGTG